MFPLNQLVWNTLSGVYFTSESDFIGFADLNESIDELAAINLLCMLTDINN